LSACSPFDADASVVRHLDEEVAGWDVASVGNVIVECSESASLGAQYHHTLVLRGDGTWDEVQERLSEAGFEPVPTGSDDPGRASFERRDPERVWSVGVELLAGEVARGPFCGQSDMEAGDTLVGFVTTTEETP